jgi:hypothetical protein
MGSMPQATPSGRRRKNLGRGPGNLPALKIEGELPRMETVAFAVASSELLDD